jgi:hypothetical protein
VHQDIQKALKLASSCEYAEAIWLARLFSGHDGPMTSLCGQKESQWLSSLFSGREVMSIEIVKKVFLENAGDDKRAIGFAAAMSCNVAQLRVAAELGNAYAQAVMAGETSGEERFSWAKKSAAQGERDGFVHLGNCYLEGHGCEIDVFRAKESFFCAAKLKSILAGMWFGLLCEKSDPLRYKWLGRGDLQEGYATEFWDNTVDQVALFLGGSVQGNVVFAIGCALKKRLGSEAVAIFKNGLDGDKRVHAAIVAIQVYKSCCIVAQKAIYACAIVGLRNGVVRDVRMIISRLIWSAKKNANYLVVDLDGLRL